MDDLDFKKRSDETGIDCPEPSAVGLARIYCVYDAKGEHYGKQPFVAPYRIDAIRGFEKEIADNNSMLSLYPEDYTLFEIGVWNERTGEITMYPAKISLGNALQYRRKKAE